MGNEDILNSNGNIYTVMGFQNTDSTKSANNTKIKKIYEKSNLILKLYQIILILKEEKNENI